LGLFRHLSWVEVSALKCAKTITAAPARNHAAASLQQSGHSNSDVYACFSFQFRNDSTLGVEAGQCGPPTAVVIEATHVLNALLKTDTGLDTARSAFSSRLA
jgi:hypothetical protein